MQARLVRGDFASISSSLLDLHNKSSGVYQNKVMIRSLSVIQKAKSLSKKTVKWFIHKISDQIGHQRD